MHEDPSVFAMSLQWAAAIRSNGGERKNMAGICYQQSVLTPPLSGSFCSPTPPSSFFAILGPRLSLSSILVHPSVPLASVWLSYAHHISDLSPSPPSSLLSPHLTTVSPSCLLLSLLLLVLLCRLLARPAPLLLLYFSLTPLHHVTFGCSCHGDHPHFPGMQSCL